MITADRLRELLKYDPETGVFVWRVARGRARPGGVAGTPDPEGYVEIQIDGYPYRAHRLAWLWMTGSFPKDLLDHRNRDTADNRWVNLREATRCQNNQNARMRKDNSLGVKGVRIRKGGP